MTHIEVTEERPLNCYRTEIPNIVFDIGLSCYELALYAHLRRTAGQDGRCFKGTRRIAEETGISLGQISDVRKKLCEPRSELGGKPLIIMEKVQDPKCGERCVVTIVDIWRENMNRFYRVHSTNTPVHSTNTPCSPHERRKEPFIGKGSPSPSAPESLPAPRSKKSSSISREEMERAIPIYNAYPRKEGRKKALEKIAQALRRIEFDELLRLTTAYAVAKEGQDVTYIPHPATWFGQERYHDDQSNWSKGRSKYEENEHDSKLAF